MGSSESLRDRLAFEPLQLRLSQSMLALVATTFAAALSLSAFQDPQRSVGDITPEARVSQLSLEADRLLETGNTEGAVQKLKEIATECNRIRNYTCAGTILDRIGLVYSNLGLYDQALPYFADALPLRISGDYRQGVADTQSHKGMILEQLGKHEDALQSLQEALQVYRELNSRVAEGAILNNIGFVQFRLNHPETSVELFKRSLEIMQAINDRLGQGKALVNIGAMYSAMKKGDEALTYFKRGLELFEQDERSQEALSAMGSIATLYDEKDDRESELIYLRRRATAAVKLRAFGIAAECFNQIAELELRRRDIPNAIADYQQEVINRRENGEYAAEGRAKAKIALAYLTLREPLKALDELNDFLSLSRAKNDRAGEGMALSYMGAVHMVTGQPTIALDLLQKARAIQEASGDAIELGVTLNNIAWVYSIGNNIDKAREIYSTVVDIMRETRNPFGELKALKNLANAYGDERQYSKALDTFDLARVLSRNLQDREEEASILQGISVMYSDTGRISDALKTAKEAMALRSQIGSARLANSVSAVATINVDRHHFAEAIAGYEDALKILQKNGDFDGQAVVLYSLGLAYEAKYNYPKALDCYNKSIALQENERRSIKGEEFKRSLAREPQFLGAHQHAVLLLLRLGLQAAAFNLAERCHARAFFDELSARRESPSKLERVQGAESDSIRAEIRSSEHWIEVERSKPVDNQNYVQMRLALNRLDALRRDYQAMLLNEQVSDGRQEASDPSPLTLQEVQQRIPLDTTLLLYLLTNEKLVIFVVSRTSCRSVVVRVNNRTLNQVTVEFRRALQGDTSNSSAATQLNGWLLAPVKAMVKTTNVVIVPHGFLHLIPFAALGDGNRLMGSQHTVSYLPNASTLGYLKRKPLEDGLRVLAMGENEAEGLPTLRFAEEEAAEVARAFNTEAFIGNKASRSTFLEQAPQAGIIHLAAHAEFNRVNAWFSRVRLATRENDDGSLTVRDVYGLDLTSARLVVLSGCDTQLGTQDWGDEVAGLNRGFLHAGAESVIATLWSVDDAISSVLMKDFYEQLKNGRGKANALRDAQAAIRCQYPTRSEWAAFVLTGDPGEDKSSSHAISLNSCEK